MSTDIDLKSRARSLGKETLLGLHLQLIRIRLFEERAAELLEAKEINTACHLYIGQEAVATGVCKALRNTDLIWGNHRSHGHYLAKGGDMRSIMAELLCKATGCAKGRGGSMHLYNKEIGMLGTVPMVAATIPIGVGAALAAKLKKTDDVSVAFFGDGATEEGIFFEAINFAALHKLPMIFVCENNYMSSHLPLTDRRTTEKLFELVAMNSMHSIRADGMNVIEMYDLSTEAVERARRGDGPTFIEAETYRFRGHVGPKDDLDVGIRDRDILQSWIDRDPILQLESLLVSEGYTTAAKLETIRKQVLAEVADSVEFARNSPDPDGSGVLDHVFIGGAK
ncbi:MAG: thiamine pyrophosphate-dependent dehydrogenase E1 component subunit alpha [Armatimonadetes bacterium]|nr:thiamine pyrophosphate-dependent dehydrogenase E1 component subunit alpha [Armatimonadota bacterium]